MGRCRDPRPPACARLGLAGRTALVVTLRTEGAATGDPRRPSPSSCATGRSGWSSSPFRRDELERLAAAVRGPTAPEADEAAVDALLERTGGNPFLAVELIEAGLLEPGAPDGVVPASLRDILDARLGALDDVVLDVLRAAAMQPGPIDDELLAAVLGRPVGVGRGGAPRGARRRGADGRQRRPRVPPRDAGGGARRPARKRRASRAACRIRGRPRRQAAGRRAPRRRRGTATPPATPPAPSRPTWRRSRRR